MTAPEGPRPFPPAHTLRVAISGTRDGQRWANVFWVRNVNQTIPDFTDLVDFTQFMGNAYTNAFASVIHQAAFLTSIDVLYYGATGIDAGHSEAVNIPMVRPGMSPSNQLSTGISWSVQAHYRGGHPRTYLPPPAAEDLDGGAHFDAGFCTDVAVAANSFHTSVNGYSHPTLQSLKLGTVSFQNRKAWRPVGLFRDYEPGAASCDARPDTQRRRLGRDV